MQDFRNLTVWQMARQLTKSIYRMTVVFPGSEEFGLKSQMRRASVSICTNLAEGCGSAEAIANFAVLWTLRWALLANLNAKQS